jgi:hypothetical protein
LTDRTIKTGIKYGRDRLKRPDVKQEYVEELNNFNWQTLQQIIIETADKVIGKIGRAERNEWYNDECKESTKNQNEAYYRTIKILYKRG